MKVGQTRRLIIPPKLGFVQSGLGPLPEQPWQRWTLNNLLDQMISQQGGRLIYDVTLKLVLDDEADQGYYEGNVLFVCVCVCVAVLFSIRTRLFSSSFVVLTIFIRSSFLLFGRAIINK